MAMADRKGFISKQQKDKNKSKLTHVVQASRHNKFFGTLTVVLRLQIQTYILHTIMQWYNIFCIIVYLTITRLLSQLTTSGIGAMTGHRF